MILYLRAGVIRGVVWPVSGAFLLLVGMCFVAARFPAPRPRRSDRGLPPGAFGPLLRDLAITAVGGYVVFIAVIAMFSVWIDGDRGALASAAWSGAMFVGLALVAFPALAAFRTYRLRRRGGDRVDAGDAGADAR